MFRVISQYQAKETVEKLKEAVNAEGMYLLCHIPASTNVARIGLETPFHEVMEVFHPEYAARVWRLREEAGIAIPVRSHVYESSSGRVQVDCQRPSTNLGLFPEPEMATIGNELDPIFERIVQSVGAKPD